MEDISMTQLIVGVDLDDVLMDFNSALCLFHNAQYGTTLTRADITSYHLEETWRCTQEEAIRRVNEFYWSFEHNVALPVSGAVETLQALQGMATFFVVTSRPESVGALTHIWLAKNFSGLFQEVHFTSHFFHTEAQVTKGEVCRRLGIQVFVDDAPLHVDEVASGVEDALLFDTPWNQSHKPEYTNIRRVYSWSEIRTLLEEKPRR